MKKVMVHIEHLKKAYGEKTIIKDLSLDVYEGEFLTFLGASGCGKTTVLRTISGIDPVTSGKIYIDGQDETNLDPTKRAVNTIFQNYALFPFMNVEKNIGFGLKMKKVKASEIQKRVKEMLSLVQLEGYEKRMPIELSGGQQQRVAIARGLINNPKVLLLDEPISALDQKLRKQMQIELKALQKKLGITFIYVTHDQEEALTMSDRVVLLNDGEIEQVDTPYKIYRHPKTKYVADFIGESNLFAGEVNQVEPKRAWVTLENGQIIEINNQNCHVGEKINVLIRPEDFRLTLEAHSQNYLEVKIKQVIYSGSFYKVLALWNGMQLLITCKDKEDILKNNSMIKVEWDLQDAEVIKEAGHHEKK